MESVLRVLCKMKKLVDTIFYQLLFENKNSQIRKQVVKYN